MPLQLLRSHIPVMTEPLIKRKRSLAQQKDTVSIYVRNYSKKAITLKVPPKVKVSSIKSNIMKRMKVQAQDQVLFLNGNRIPDDIEEIQVQNRNIFHLANMKRVGLQSMTIFVKRVQRDSPTFKYNVYSQMKISDFMRELFSMDYEDYENYFLVYTGREMMPQNTFQHEYVEDQSELLCVHKTQDRKSQFIEIRRVPNRQSNSRNFNMLKRKPIQEKQQEYPEKINNQYNKFSSNSTETDNLQNKNHQESKQTKSNSKQQQEDEKVDESGKYSEKEWIDHERSKQNADDKAVDERQYTLEKNDEEMSSEKNIIAKTENSSEFIEIMKQRTHKIERKIAVQDFDEQNKQVKEQQQNELQNQDNHEETEKNIEQQLVKLQTQAKQNSDAQMQNKAQKNVTHENPEINKQKSNSEFEFPSSPYDFKWKNIDDSKTLVQVSSKIEQDKIDFQSFLPHQLSKQKHELSCRFQQNIPKFERNSLMMLGNPYSLGLEYIRDDTYLDFSRKLQKLGITDF